MTNREAWREGYKAGLKGLNPRPDYPLVGLAGSYRLGYEAGYKRRKEPKGPKQNPGFLRHALTKHKVNQARKRLQAEIARVQNRINELEQEVIEYRHGPIWKGDKRAAQWAAQASLKKQKLQAIEKRLVRGLEELPMINPRRNGIVEAAAGLQALEFFGKEAKRGIGRKPKFNPGEARFLLQIITFSGKREQITATTEKQAKEIAASWYSRGASVTVIDRKKKTQTVYGKRNPMKRTNAERQFVTEHHGYKVYFEGSSYSCPMLKLFGYSTERAIKNAIDKILRKRGQLPAKNPRGSRDALGVFHAENPSKKVTAEEVARAHKAFAVAADRGYPDNARTPGALQRVDAQIARLREKWERLARQYKAQQKSNPLQPRGKSVTLKLAREIIAEAKNYLDRTWPDTDAERKAVQHLSSAYQAAGFSVERANVAAKRELARKHKKKNPSVIDLSRTFQGEADGSVDKMYAADGAPANLARAGKLVFLKVNGKTYRLPDAYVAIAPNERLWITGPGALFDTKARKGEGLDVGEVTHICYETAKAHIENGKTVEYVHEFGEDGGRRPHLIIDHEGMPILRGGDYKIRAEGIVN